MAIDLKLRELTQLASDQDVWRPALLDVSRDEGRRTMEALFQEGRVLAVHDYIDDQLEELLATRTPTRRAPEELKVRVAAHLAGAPPHEYGTWVYYPWSQRLVHVLPEGEYRELRSSRNCYRLTPAEQRRLRSCKIGIVGLSVGSTCAITAAMEGVGGEFRLADFDRLSLSNMNRLRTPVHNLGLHKCIIAAREMLEIDPYLHIKLFQQGLSDETMDSFLGEGGQLDLLLEECDDLYMKLLVRERARARGIPVVMDTNERGMLDIERFDREPNRPVLHGLLDEVSADEVKGLPTPAKVPHVIRILGQSGMSSRLLTSLFEIGETISSWPQLASSVALGGALTTYAARKILLGQMNDSGRFFVDVDAMLRDGGALDLSSTGLLDKALRRSSPLVRQEPRLVRAGRTVTAVDIRRVVAHGILAPSRGNAQPWRFVARTPLLHRPGRVRCYADREPTFLDFEGSLTAIAIGAAVENMELASCAMGLHATVRPFPDATDSAAVCELVFSVDSGAEVPPLAAQIAKRATSRKPDLKEPISQAGRRALGDAAATAGARLQWLTTPAALEELGAVQGAVDRLMWLTKPIFEELSGELRWTQDEVESTRDGHDVTALDLHPGEIMRLWLMRNWSALETLGAIGGGRSFERSARMLFGASPNMALLTVSGAGRESYFRGGRALQRVWLTASSLGLSIHPYSELISLFARLTRGKGVGLSSDAIQVLTELRPRFRGLFDAAAGEAEIMLLRVHQGGPPSARSLRRPLGSVLAFEDARGRRVRPSPVG